MTKRYPDELRDALCEMAQSLTGTQHEPDEPALDIAVDIICGQQDRIERLEELLAQRIAERNAARDALNSMVRK